MKTLVVCGNPHNGESHRVRELIKAKFDANVILAPFNSFERQIVVAAPDLVLVVLGENSEPGLGALHRSRQCHKGLLVAVGPASDPQLILRSLQEGADNYLDVNAIESNLGAVVARLGQKEEVAPTTTGVMIALLGASGGSGTSTIAASMAVVLAQKCNGCALVDFKPGRGDLAALLDLKPSFTIADISRHGTWLIRCKSPEMGS